CSVIFRFSYKKTSPTHLYPLSLHDALPIFDVAEGGLGRAEAEGHRQHGADQRAGGPADGEQRQPARRNQHVPGGEHEQRSQRARSEEHTSELQSPCNLVCRLLLEKKKKSMY